MQGGEVLALRGRRNGPLEIIQHRGKVEQQSCIGELDRLFLVAIDAFAEVLEVGLLAQQRALQRDDLILELVQLFCLRGIGIRLIVRGSTAACFAGCCYGRGRAACGGIRFVSGSRCRVRFRNGVRARSGRTAVGIARGSGAAIGLRPFRAAGRLHRCGTVR